jgi:hypothetical protein
VFFKDLSSFLSHFKRLFQRELSSDRRITSRIRYILDPAGRIVDSGSSAAGGIGSGCK